jgi:hypothetical protein
MKKTAEIKGGATIWARQTLESDIFFTKPHAWFKIWFYLVNKANHQDNGRFKRGECFVQYYIICELTGAKKDEVKRCMSWLKNRGSISTKRSTRGVNVTLTNYDYYQTLENYEYKKIAPDKAPDMLSGNNQDKTKETLAGLPDKQEWENRELENEEGSTLGPSCLGLDVFNPKNKVTSWSFTDEYSAGTLLNRAIRLFEPIFPGEFAGKNSALAKQTTRDVVEAMLERYSLDDLNEVIFQYKKTINERYRPQANTIHDFCTTKLAAIEDFLYRMNTEEDENGEIKIYDRCFDGDDPAVWEKKYDRPWIKKYEKIIS